MSRYRFELATPADDADLRQVLADTPMAGRISVAFRREPSYFDAGVVDGRFRQVVAARDLGTGRIIGFGSRSVAERYVNGRPEGIGYLSNLRLHEKHRNGSLVARGYAYFRRLHSDGRARLYLTTIAEDNEAAIDMLTCRRAGLPAYHFAGRYHTIALARSQGANRARNDKSIAIRPAEAVDVPMALGLWNNVGVRRQFFPCYTSEDFFSSNGAFRGLNAEDLLLAFRHGELIGTMASWDQSAFRQTVINGYSAALRLLRPLYNQWASWRGEPKLPKPGQRIRYRSAALFVVADDNLECARALLDAALKRQPQSSDYLLLGLHEFDPLLSVLRDQPARWYTTRLYYVCWEDGEELRQSLDGRTPYLELGSL